jgi:hypothetical protein
MEWTRQQINELTPAQLQALPWSEREAIHIFCSTHGVEATQEDFDRENAELLFMVEHGLVSEDGDEMDGYLLKGRILDFLRRGEDMLHLTPERLAELKQRIRPVKS